MVFAVVFRLFLSFFASFLSEFEVSLTVLSRLHGNLGRILWYKTGVQYLDIIVVCTIAQNVHSVNCVLYKVFVLALTIAVQQCRVE